MLNSALGALATLGFACFIGFAAPALQGAEHPEWLWGFAFAGLAVFVLAGLGWLATRESASRTKDVSPKEAASARVC